MIAKLIRFFLRPKPLAQRYAQFRQAYRGVNLL
jgi:hypothetical protein